MEYKHRIKAIRDRAANIGAAMTDVCAAADVNVSTLFRWEQEDANPRMRQLFRALDAMEADLTERERRIVTDVATRTPQVVMDVLDELGSAA
jgi:predicted transcriptional regulator